MPVLVSIGIPTHDRVDTLKRALRSALNQTHADLEVIVSDNASGDGTRAFCEHQAASDPRVRYLRHDVDRGPIANFNSLLGECTGDYVMLLADDDWIDASYVERCLEALAERPDLAVAAGRALHYRGDARVGEGKLIELDQRTGARRVIAFLRAAGLDAIYYGLIPRPVLERLPPMRNVIGHDWLVVASLAFLGKVTTVDSAFIHQALGGTSENVEKIAGTSGLPPFQARNPHLAIGWFVLEDIVRRSPVYRSLGPFRRLALALACQPSLLRRWVSFRYGTFMNQPRVQRSRPLALARGLRDQLRRT